MKLLSRNEEIILLAILRLPGNAYGISIRDFIHEKTGSEWSFANIYDPLNKLTRKGLVCKYKGEPTKERGGRHKVLYEITKEGKAVLTEMNRVHNNLWDSEAAQMLEKS